MYAIELNKVWKKFKKGEKFYALRDLIPKMTKNLLTSSGKKNGDLTDKEFWALQNIDFKIKKGEVVGIIGPNGAGKSTLLKLLSRIMKPTEGEFNIKGRLSALIEVTAGFHPEFTGRENVYFNGSVIGMKKKEIDEKFEEIVDFSGVRDFIDTPVKRYSSGMSARLGFAVAAHVNPDVLLVDEVLSVGDMTFQAKCTQKMRELLKSGTTIIFVSHNIPLVQNLCQRLILINKGQVLIDGPSEEVIPVYENLVNDLQEEELKKKLSKLEPGVEGEKTSAVLVKSIETVNGKGDKTDSFSPDEQQTFKVKLVTNGEIKTPKLNISVFRADNVKCMTISTNNVGVKIDKLKGEETIYFELNKSSLVPGAYYTKFSVWDDELVHPYIIAKGGIFKIEAAGETTDMTGVFIPDVKSIRKE